MISDNLAWNYDRSMMDGSGWGWGVLMMLFWVMVIVLVVMWLSRNMGGSQPNAHKSGDPLDIAKERYARGEINKAEFEQLKKDLK